MMAARATRDCMQRGLVDSFISPPRPPFAGDVPKIRREAGAIRPANDRCGTYIPPNVLAYATANE